MKRHLKAVVVVLALFGIALWVFYSRGGVGLFTPEALKHAVEGWGSVGPLLYIGFYALASVLFVPGTPLTLVGGALFGPFFGTIYTVIGATFGACLAFLLARFASGLVRPEKVGPIARRLAGYDKKIKENGFLTVLMLRLIPLFPFNGLNFGLGLTSVTFRSYFFATFFGIIPGTAAYVYFGDSLASLKITNIIFAIVIIAVIALVGKYVAKHYSSRT